MLRFLIKRNLSTLSTVIILLWIFILPFLESWWYIYQIIQGNYAYQPDWKEKNDLRSSYKKFYIAVRIGFSFSFPESTLCSLDVSWWEIQSI